MRRVYARPAHTAARAASSVPGVPIRRIDHVYAETLQWEESVSFWEGLGFTFVERWGSEGHRAGRFQSGEAAVVLAEVTESTPEFTVFFDLDEADLFDPGVGVSVTTALTDTHWGTRWIRASDPEGRTHAFEELA